MKTEKQIKEKLRQIADIKHFSSYGIMRSAKSWINALLWVLGNYKIPYETIKTKPEERKEKPKIKLISEEKEDLIAKLKRIKERLDKEENV